MTQKKLHPSGIGNGHIYTEAKPCLPVLGDIWNNPKDNAELAWILEGSFSMGSDVGRNDEKPVHTVRLTGYWMYRTHVTVEQYLKFCVDTEHRRPPEPSYSRIQPNPDWKHLDHPIVYVSWDDAQAYCQWAGVCLPSEAQWERAAKGPQGFTYPWGNTFKRSKLWCSKADWGDSGGTQSVGKFPENGFGLFDMAGNAFQWCEDAYAWDFYSSLQAGDTDPVNKSSDDWRVVRGGSWDCPIGNSNSFRASNRFDLARQTRIHHCGFRCVSPGYGPTPTCES